MAVFSLSTAEIKRINRISHCVTLAADALSAAEQLAVEGFDAQSRSVADKRNAQDAIAALFVERDNKSAT
jgi:hypothetical protein